MPSTLVHGFLPSSCCLVAKDSFPKLDKFALAKMLFIAFILGNSCDLDIIPAMLQPAHWRDFHRQWGHNIFAISLWITLGRFAFVHLVSPRFRGKLGWLLAMALVFSHVFLDACGDYTYGSEERVGVPLLWPVSDWELLMPFAFFKSYQLSDNGNPLMAHILSVDFWTRAVLSEVLSSLLLLTMFSFGYFGWRRWGRLTRKPTYPRTDGLSSLSEATAKSERTA